MRSNNENNKRKSTGKRNASASRKRVPPFLVLSVFQWPDGVQQANVIDWSHPHNIRTFGGKASGVLHRGAEVRTRSVRCWDDVPAELHQQIAQRAHGSVIALLNRGSEAKSEASNEELRLDS